MTAPGEVARELPAQVQLERWYRRLLWAYPVGYRRSHGEEILTMLLDSAEPGRRVPARADVVDVLRGAVRQWFRLPIGRTAVLSAVLSAVVLGAVGAGVGSWLAWQTGAALPSDTEALQTAETVAGVPMNAPDVTRIADRGEPHPRVYVFALEQALPNWTLAAAQARLRADGWTLGTVRESTNQAVRGRPASPVYSVQATRGNLELEAVGDTFRSGGTGTIVHVGIHPVRPDWEPAAILVGGLAGAVIGWLLTGFASYRLRGRTLPRRLTVLALGVTALGFAADPTIGLYETLAGYAFGDPEPVRPSYPAYYWVAARPATERIGGALAIGLMILVLAATGRRRSEERPTATAA
ncbi:hypothetical protein [Salinispora vitiensis]|uniref:hypothetical protein n=1 Tax=Salinispora vitiensis TaxID=999544 RepID=UPI00035FB141|nr:hypothetical protein [Salinispora vitiensis]